MSDTIDIKSLLDSFIDKGGVVIYGNNNTVVFGNHFSGSSGKEKKAKANPKAEEDDFTVNPTEKIEVEADLNRNSVDAPATADDKAKAEDIVRKLETLEDEDDFDTDLLYDAGNDGFDIAEKIIEIGLHHFDGLEITVDNIDAVNAVLKEHYDDKK